jgi:cytochrome c-type biogenesis protein CcmF
MIFVPALKLQTFKKLGKDSIIKLFISMALSILLSALLFFIGFEIVTFLAILLSLGVIFSAISYFKKPRNNSNQSLKDAFSYYSMFLAHVGFSIIILSICVNSLMSKTIQSNVTIGEEIEVNSYKVKFEKVDHGYGKNYLTRIGVFKITSGDKVSYLKPESRYYPVTDQNTSEAAIKHSFFSDLYVVLGEKNDENSFSLRIYHKFFISFIWLGCFMMFLSGIVYLFKSYHLDRSSKALLE